MRKAPWILAEQYRTQRPGYKSKYGERFGWFMVPRNGTLLRCLATDGDFKAAGLGPEWAWEHVSVSTEKRTPTWAEMDYIKNLFWAEDECVMQLHVPKTEHINCKWAKPVRAQTGRRSGA